MNLIVQSFVNGLWSDAARLNLEEPEKGRFGNVTLNYEPEEYALKYLMGDGISACSLMMPVDLMTTYRSKYWFGFLDDLVPSGAARRYWLKKWNLEKQSSIEQDRQLLLKGSSGSVGNLHIKALDQHSQEATQSGATPLCRKLLIEDGVALLDGSTHAEIDTGIGVGGEAPKLLVRKDSSGQLWVDSTHSSCERSDSHYLVKFPRGRQSQLDNDILRAEYHYYRELQDMKMPTMAVDGLELIEGDRYPSLWLPRFDVSIKPSGMERYGLESMYSVLGLPPGSFLNHFQCLQQLCKVLNRQYLVAECGGVFDQTAFVTEWIKRDFLNVCFGNSDNHGRNTSLIKLPSKITLSPIYDFAPMKADPDGIARSTTWGAPFEVGGNFDWIGIARALSDLADPDQIISELRNCATKVLGLRDRLAARGVSTSIVEMPAMGLRFLDKKLSAWQLK